jgi:hypothetical protein
MPADVALANKLLRSIRLRLSQRLSSIEGQSATRSRRRTMAEYEAIWEQLGELHEMDDPNSLVTRAYHLVVGREPDSGEFDYYTSRLRSGLSTKELLATLASSPEGRAAGMELVGYFLRRGQLGEPETAELENFDGSEFIAMLYRVIIRQHADDTAIGQWLQLMDKGRLTKRQVIEIFQDTHEPTRLEREPLKHSSRTAITS